MKKNNKQPLVSVIMPIYNTGKYLQEALDSVCQQTYRNIELIAIDDKSTDTSFSLLQKYARKEKRLRIFRLEKNCGVGQAASFGIKKAHGSFIARVDSDDIIPLDRIEKQVQYLVENPDVIVLGGQVELVNKNGVFIVKKHFPLTHTNIINMAFTAMPIQQGAMMVNKRLLPKDFTWYREELKTSEDLDFLLRVFQYGKGANLSDTCLYYRQHGQSVTQARKPKEIFFQAHKVRQVARNQYGIQPKRNTLIISYFQYALVAILPERFIYPLYYLWRGIRPLRSSRNEYRSLLIHAVSYIL